MAAGEIKLFGVPVLRRVPGKTETHSISRMSIEEMIKKGAKPVGQAHADLTRTYQTDKLVLTAQGWIALGGLAITLGGFAAYLELN